MKGKILAVPLSLACFLSGCTHYKSDDYPADKYIQDAKSLMTNTSNINDYNHALDVLMEGLGRYEPSHVKTAAELAEYNKLAAFYPQAMTQALDYCRQQINAAKTDDEIIIANLCMSITSYNWTHSTMRSHAKLEKFAQYGAPKSEVDKARETLAKVNYKLSKRNDAPTESENRNNRFARLYLTEAYDNPKINGSESKNIKAEIKKAYTNMIHYIVVQDDSGYVYDHDRVVKKYIIPQILSSDNAGGGKKEGLHSLDEIYARQPVLIYYDTGKLASFVQYDIVDKPSSTGLNYYLRVGVDSIKGANQQDTMGGDTTTVQSVENECRLVKNEEYDKNSRKRGDKSHSPRRLKKECRNVIAETEEYSSEAQYDTDFAFVKYHYQLTDQNGKVLFSGAYEATESRSLVTDENGNTTLYYGGSEAPVVRALKGIGGTVGGTLREYMKDQCKPTRICL